MPISIFLTFMLMAGNPSAIHGAAIDARSVWAYQSAAPSQAPASGGSGGQKTDPPSTPSTSPKQPERFVWKPRPSLRFGKILRVDFEAKFHEDVRSSYDGADVLADLNTFELRRSRVGIQGELFQHVEFEVERELIRTELTADELAEGKTPRSPWKDVYADADYVKWAQVRAGKFKIPFGLDELTGITQNDFVYRSLGAEYLAPARDIGAMLHGRFFNRGLNYWVGLFQHDGDNARSKAIAGGDRTLAVRVTAAPLRRVSGGHFKTLVVGGAATSTELSNDSFRPNGLRGRTVMTEDTFFSPVYVNGRRLRWEGDIDWILGSASLRAEGTRVTDDRLGQGIDGRDLPEAIYSSWYVSGTYLVTGEKKARPVKPRAEFLRGGAGAFELAARYEQIRYAGAGGRDAPFRNPRAETILPSGESALTLGVNWVLNQWVTVQINAVRERVEDPERSPVPNGAAFWSRVLRFQFAL